MTRPFGSLPAALAVAAAALALAACGSGSSSSSTGAGGNEEEKRLAFQDCLRGKGIDLSFAADGRGLAIGARRGPGSGDTPDTATAMEECRESSGWSPPQPSAEQREEFRERALQFARCMREHGADVDDPAPDGRMLMRVRGDSPTFRAAQEACGGRFGMRAPTAPAAPTP